MTAAGMSQIVLYLVVLVGLSWPLGMWMARVYESRPLFGLERVLGPLERLIYRVIGIDPEREQDWKAYAFATLAFGAVSLLAVYGLQRLQALLPLNPGGMAAVAPHLSFSTAASFATNTNWQSYGGETTLSHFTQMIGLTVQNFVSAAMGMAVLAALARAFHRRESETVGNFWVDLTRGTLYILLPLSAVLAFILVSQGVVQTLDWSRTAQLVQPVAGADGTLIAEQSMVVGPTASQVAIKQLGTNGGGFFNVNSSHPFENSTPLSNFFELLSILIISAALCHTFGRMVADKRQGWALLAAMVVIFVPLLLLGLWAEQSGNPRFNTLGVDQTASALHSGGNMEGKEVRNGVANSVLWSAATTAASNGSVNSMHDSYTPLGGLVPMFLMQLGEVVFGGVGSGLYGMIVFAIVAVFIAGLMVGRTPEYLGKKIEPFEMKMASVAVLIPPLMVLLASAITVVLPSGVSSIQDTGGPHGFSEVLYNYSSMGNNNGSAFAGFNANVPLANTMGGVVMLFARFWVLLPVLAIAGSIARKRTVPAGPGTLPTHTPLFVIMLVGVVIIVGALTFIPALALGPIVEHLLLHS
jgi:K+-transporting ATPase ATPase A chain